VYYMCEFVDRVEFALSTLFQADVIFCTAEKDLVLNRGAVSRSLLEAAGPGLQDECKQRYPQGINYGEVVPTGGHQLRCRKVYHGVCTRWDGNSGRTEKVLRVFSILRRQL
jgi:O-acetyl-ADP-ribose deacetylase (regulator of RNase III)